MRSVSPNLFCLKKFYRTAIITDSSLAPFEWQQSQIIEHIIEALAWFNLQLYQSTSGYDASNSNITIVEKKANYRRNIDDNGKIQ